MEAQESDNLQVDEASQQIDGLQMDEDEAVESGITPAAQLVKHADSFSMKDSERSYQAVPMGMGSQLMRDRFHYLCGLTGRRTLPPVFVDGAFVGG